MEGEYVYEKNNINDNNQNYNLKVFVDGNSISFKLELNNDIKKIFSNQFDQSYFSNMEETFENRNIKNIFDDLYEILDNGKYKIKNDSSTAEIILHKNRNTTLIFNLNEEIDEVNINYDCLSNEMKKIIDKNELILGIDLGTTYSCAAVMIDNHFIIIQNSLGEKTISSYVAFLSKNKIYVGDLAKVLPSNEKNIIFNLKRLIGKSYKDKEIKKIIDEKLLPFDLIDDNEFDSLKIKVEFELDNKKEYHYYYPEQIYALILKKIIIDSEYFLSEKIGNDKKIQIKNVVITIPAYFNQKQRLATKNAAEIIGLNVKGMINEPTAASLAYSYKIRVNIIKYIVVIDFGGGTLDITLLKFEKNESMTKCVVEFTYGDTNFGGENFDYILMEKCTNKSKKNLNQNLSVNVRLKRVCEKAKINLTKQESTRILLEEYENKKNINEFVTRKQFKKYCSQLFKKFDEIMDKFKEDCGIDENKINEVILIGGTTFIPEIEERIAKKFGEKKIKKDLDRKEVVAIGASIQGARISNLSFVNHIKLKDVTNLSLGVNVKGDKMSKLIERSSNFPAQGTDNYCTVSDNQTVALIKVFEGESENNLENLCLGEFTIHLPKKRAGEAKIKIDFLVDNLQLLNVTATEIANINNSEKRTFKYEASDENIIKEQKLDVVEPKNIRQIIKDLKIIQNEVQFIDFNEYNNIKKSIIEKEGEIFIFSKKGDSNKVNIRNIKKEVVEMLNECCENILKNINYTDEKINDMKKNKREEEIISITEENNIKKKLFLSFLKFLFKKINEYFVVYSNANDKELKEKIKFNLQNYFNNIQYYNDKIIYEMIEDFEPNNEIYDVCLSILIDNYDGKLIEKYCNISLNKNLEELNNLNEIIDKCITLYNKINNRNILNNLKEKYLYFQEYKTKIKIKKLLLTNKNEIDDKLLEQFENSKFLEINDLEDLNILGKLKVNQKDFIDYETEDKNELLKAKNFENKLDSLYKLYKDKTNRYLNWEDFVFIFKEYPPIKEYIRQYSPEYLNYKGKYSFAKVNDINIIIKDLFFESRENFQSFLENMSIIYEKMAEDKHNSELKNHIYIKIQLFLNNSRKFK